MNNAIAKLVTLITIVIVGIFVTFTFSEKVDEGTVKVVYSPKGGVDRVLEPGWHWFEIGFFEETQAYPTRVTIVKDSLTTTTSDGKKVTMPVRYEMKVQKDKVVNIFKEFGSQDLKTLQSGYLYQKLYKASRETISEYSVIDIYGAKASEAAGTITHKFADEVEKLGFIITDVTLGTPELDEATQQAIDARVQAAQKLEKLVLEKKIATEQAEKNFIEAQGEANVLIEKARGEAEANEILEKSITPELIKMKEMEARIKHGWVTTIGANAVVTDK